MRRYVVMTHSIKVWLLALVAMSATTLASAQDLHTFKRIQLNDQFWSEGANFGDLNNDGVNDVISGPWWWEGPDFKTRHEYYPATTTFQLKLGPMTTVTVPGFEGTLGKENTYSDNFFVWAFDFNKDGWKDILVIGFPGKDTSWFENPKGKDGHWVRHKVFDQTDNESPTFADLTGDGKPELVCITKGQYGYAEPDWSDPSKPWKFRAISPNNKYGNFTHGMGIGDVNGDGRLDLLEKNGWWEQPASLAGDPVWTFHAQPMGDRRLADVRLRRQRRWPQRHHHRARRARLRAGVVRAVREGGEITFREHIIMNKDPKENRYGVKFSRSTPSTSSTWTATGSRISSPASASGRTAAPAIRTGTTRRCSTGSSSRGTPTRASTSSRTSSTTSLAWARRSSPATSTATAFLTSWSATSEARSSTFTRRRRSRARNGRRRSRSVRRRGLSTIDARTARRDGNV